MNPDNTEICVYHTHPAGIFPGSFQICLTDSPVVAALLPLEAVGFSLSSRPLPPDRRADIEQESEIGLQAFLHPSLENADLSPIHAAAC